MIGALSLRVVTYASVRPYTHSLKLCPRHSYCGHNKILHTLYSVTCPTRWLFRLRFQIHTGVLPYGCFASDQKDNVRNIWRPLIIIWTSPWNPSGHTLTPKSLQNYALMSNNAATMAAPPSVFLILVSVWCVCFTRIWIPIWWLLWTH